MSDIQDDIEDTAEEAKDSSADQHLGDAMDDADLEAADSKTSDGELEAVGQGGPTEAGGPTHDEPEMKDDGGA
jgi:hypothetical protein